MHTRIAQCNIPSHYFPILFIFVFQGLLVMPKPYNTHTHTSIVVKGKGVLSVDPKGKKQQMELVKVYSGRIQTRCNQLTGQWKDQT